MKTKHIALGIAALASATTAIVLTTTSTTPRKYYFNAAGSDNNDGSQLSPFKNISKLNSLLATARAGDSFFLNKNDIWYGAAIKFGASGSLNKNIVISSYGEGNKPVVTGLKKITNWVSIGGNKYEAVVGSLPYLRMVSINGNPVGKGRWPNADAANSGWATIRSHYGKTSITDAALPSYISFSSGSTEIVIRTRRWVMDVCPVSSRSGTTIYYSNPTYEPANGYGYFIQNTISCLDKNGEWCYNGTTHKLTMYSNTGTPKNVEVSTLENLLVTNGKHYLTVNDIKFEGSNSDNVFINSSSTFVDVLNCDINNSGKNGILVQYMTSKNFNATGNTITNSLNIGIETNSKYNNNVSRNKITNSGMIRGLAGSGEGGMGSGLSIRHLTNKYSVLNNEIKLSGMCGILFKNDRGELHSDSLEIAYNVIDSFCIVKDDAAGMYGWAGEADPPVYKSRNIHDNLILHGVGAQAGTPTTITSAYGFYGDLGFSDANFFNNTVAYCSRAGAFLNFGGERIKVYNNTFYDNGFGMGTDMRGAHIFINYDNSRPVKNLTIEKNVMWGSGTSNLIVVTNYSGTYSSNLGTIDNNAYVYDPKKTTQFVWWMKGYPSTTSKISFAKWRARGYDLHSDTMTAAAIVPVKFDYAKDSTRIIDLGTTTYVDAERKLYTGELSISPFKAFVGRKK